MGEIKPPFPVKLIVGMISAKEDLFKKVEGKMEQKFGLIDFQSSFLPFTYTRHYESEMGKNLKRKFFSFCSLIDPEEIAEVKLFTNELEQSFLYPNSKKRCINIDPGYLSFSKLVLATTKNYAHRIYLSKGIYAEITLRYEKGKGFKPLKWTYPDYRSEVYLQIFQQIRRIYRGQPLTLDISSCHIIL